MFKLFKKFPDLFLKIRYIHCPICKRKLTITSSDWCCCTNCRKKWELESEVGAFGGLQYELTGRSENIDK